MKWFKLFLIYFAGLLSGGDVPPLSVAVPFGVRGYFNRASASCLA